MPIYMGIDLAGSPKRKSGVAVLSSSALEEISLLQGDEEIVGFAERWRPKVVAIDSPLQWTGLPYRECDLRLKELGVSPLPLTLSGMKMLVFRAMKLADRLRAMGSTVIETFPAASVRVLGYRKKPKNMSGRARLVREVLELFGISRSLLPPKLSSDEMDAVLCAIAAYSYDNGWYVSVKGNDCEIVLPLPPNPKTKIYHL